MGEQTLLVRDCLNRLAAGQPDASDRLLALTQARLLRLAARLKRDFPGVARWEQTEDVYQNAAMRLMRAIAETEIHDTRHFYRLATLQIRRELIDLARRHRGAEGHAAHHATEPPRSGNDGRADARARVEQAASPEPSQLDLWTEFHEAIGRLPDQEREVAELLWYHELPQEEVAELIGTSVRTVKRIWRRARLSLQEQLQERTIPTEQSQRLLALGSR